MSKEIEGILKRLNRNEKKRKELRSELLEAYRQLPFECKSCNATPRLSEMFCVDSYWYESPYSCTAGDQWHYGETWIICPKCGMTHRLLRDKSKQQFGKFEQHIGCVEVYDVCLNYYKNSSPGTRGPDRGFSLKNDEQDRKGIRFMDGHVLEVKGIQLNANYFVNI